MVYRLNLQHLLRDNVSWNRITIELQTGYLIIHLLMPCFFFFFFFFFFLAERDDDDLMVR